MRAFIAINFDRVIKQHLKSVQDSVKSISRSGHFSHEENLHLTLVFLGEIAPDKVKLVADAMETVDISPFALSLGQLGRFKRDDGDIVWVGIQENKALTGIYSQLCHSLRKSGFHVESRPYQPHLTLGRKVMLMRDLQSLQVPEITAQVSRISLMKSERINGKLTYSEVCGVK